MVDSISISLIAGRIYFFDTVMYAVEISAIAEKRPCICSATDIILCPYRPFVIFHVYLYKQQGVNSHIIAHLFAIATIVNNLNLVRIGTLFNIVLNWPQEILEIHVDVAINIH